MLTIGVNAVKKEKGFTLIHCLLLLSVVLILGGTTMRMTLHGTRHAVMGHWGKTAEALADGALELALSELESGGDRTTLDAVIGTGVATAQILSGSDESSYRIVFQGRVAPEERVLAGRTYEAIVLKDTAQRYRVISIRRL